MAIRVLPPNVVNKIAAGEVIERPASVVKELVENSLDAGATRIQVDLEEGGARLIRVTDDGCGMDQRDLELAFVSHATSKLADENDLFAITTMGFRGEALASVGSVADVTITARPHDRDAGYQAGMNAGTPVPVRLCGAPPGTRVEVRNIFHSVPVRKKFLKTTATEMSHVTEAITRLAIVHPEIHFELTHNDREVFNLPAAADRAERIGEFFGREIAERLVSFAWQSPDARIRGFLLPPDVDRRNTRMQYTFVNDRYVRDTTLMHAIAEAYSKLMIPGRRPVCFVFLEVDPADLDVNVHPTKMEVKFRKQRAVHQELLAALRTALREAHITPEVSLPGEHPLPTGSNATTNRSGGDSVRSALQDFFERNAPAPSPGSAVDKYRNAGGRPVNYSPPQATETRSADSTPAPPQAESVQPPRYGNCMQMCDSYIVEETSDGINLIDQHALHERILYNRFSARIEGGGLPSQQLLVPELVELPKPEFYAIMGLADDLGRFGMQIEAFGESTVLIRSFPQVLGHFDGEAFLRDLLEELEGPDGAKRVDGRLDRLLKVMACKAAVKAGQRLGPEQLRRLLEQRSEWGPTENCPHGRPTTIHLSRGELDKQFRRI